MATRACAEWNVSRLHKGKKKHPRLGQTPQMSLHPCSGALGSIGLRDTGSSDGMDTSRSCDGDLGQDVKSDAAWTQMWRRCQTSSAFADSLLACVLFSHISPVLFTEHPMTKAVLVVHTKARVYSSLWAQDQHKNVSSQSPSHLFIPAFLTKVFSLIKKECLTTGTFSPCQALHSPFLSLF